MRSANCGIERESVYGCVGSLSGDSARRLRSSRQLGERYETRFSVRARARRWRRRRSLIVMTKSSRKLPLEQYCARRKRKVDTRLNLAGLVRFAKACSSESYVPLRRPEPGKRVRRRPMDSVWRFSYGLCAVGR
jgi:hypothetical protein